MIGVKIYLKTTTKNLMRRNKWPSNGRPHGRVSTMSLPGWNHESLEMDNRWITI